MRVATPPAGGLPGRQRRRPSPRPRPAEQGILGDAAVLGAGAGALIWVFVGGPVALAALPVLVGVLLQVDRRVGPTGARLLPRWKLVLFAVLALLMPVAAAASDPATAVVPAVASVVLVLRLALVVHGVNRRTGPTDRLDALQRELRHRATHDPLTGLANRATLVRRLDRVLAGAERAEHLLLLVDLDDFRDINDTLGHLAGDAVLVEAARRLRAALPDAALLARLGADEFAALCHGAGSDVADRVLAALRPPVRAGGREVHLTGGVGLLPLTDQRRSADALRDADLALDAAKRAGRDRLARFDPGLRAARDRQAELTDGLRRALAEPDRPDGLSLHYQPVVRLADGRIIAVEALLRWPLAPPATFVPVAEASGLIVPLGWWVLRRACEQARGWHAEHAVLVTVNVSGHQLREPDFAERVLALLAETGLPADALVLELTETTLIAATGQLDSLRAAGVRVAIDDFGTGYSSLSTLAHLPVDVLKIDRMLTRRPAFTRAILELAGSLRLDTIAEGVETAEQARALLALGCPYAQGFHFARPVPADAIDALLSAVTSPA